MAGQQEKPNNAPIPPPPPLRRMILKLRKDVGVGGGGRFWEGGDRGAAATPFSRIPISDVARGGDKFRLGTSNSTFGPARGAEYRALKSHRCETASPFFPVIRISEVPPVSGASKRCVCVYGCVRIRLNCEGGVETIFRGPFCPVWMLILYHWAFR